MEPFKANMLNWSMGEKDGSSKGVVKNGYYFWESTIEAHKKTSKYVFINPKRDFEIETRFARISSASKSSLQSFTFGSDEGIIYYFGIDALGRFKIHSSDGSFYHLFQDTTTSSHIDPSSLNTLTVRKIGQIVSFYINSQLVFETEINSIVVDRVGFQTGFLSKIMIDYIAVHALEKL